MAKLDTRKVFKWAQAAFVWLADGYPMSDRAFYRKHRRKERQDGKREIRKELKEIK